MRRTAGPRGLARPDRRVMGFPRSRSVTRSERARSVLVHLVEPDRARFHLAPDPFDGLEVLVPRIGPNGSSGPPCRTTPSSATRPSASTSTRTSTTPSATHWWSTRARSRSATGRRRAPRSARSSGATLACSTSGSTIKAILSMPWLSADADLWQRIVRDAEVLRGAARPLTPGRGSAPRPSRRWLPAAPLRRSTPAAGRS